jgi:hypothetical protein
VQAGFEGPGAMGNEPDFQELEYKLHLSEFEYRKELEQSRRGWITPAVSIATALISVGAIIVTLILTQKGYKNSAEQFRTQFEQSTREFESRSRDEHYNQIITGLGSDAAAVQANSMRLLTEYVRDPSNFADESEQTAGIHNAIQVLTAFMEDNSSVPGKPGLSNYQSPIPITLSRAMTSLTDMLEDEDLGRNKADISRANLHGAPMPGFAPLGGFLAVAADFRRASMSGLDLRRKPAELQSAFFTCADLTGARFGAADLDNADLTGADLRGANLSRVQNLYADQVNGITVDEATKLPPTVEDPSAPGWGIRSNHCVNLVDNMTGMRGGQGYTPLRPCPKKEKVAKQTDFEPAYPKTLLDDLVEACISRDAN